MSPISRHPSLEVHQRAALLGGTALAGVDGSLSDGELDGTEAYGTSRLQCRAGRPGDAVYGFSGGGGRMDGIIDEA